MDKPGLVGKAPEFIFRVGRSTMPQARQPLSTALTAMFLLLFVSAPALADGWKLEFDSRQLPSLSYSENGAIIFQLGCGRAFGLHVKYPGTAGKAGKASIAIGSARARVTLDGEFEEPEAADQTNFVQWDLGFSRQDPELFGKRWKKAQSRLLDLIERAAPLIISQGANSYRLPRIDAANWRSAIEKCGDE